MDWVVILIVVAVVFFIFICGYLNEKRARINFVELLRCNYGADNSRKYTADELKAVKGLHQGITSEYELDDITWNDLDMWSVYKKINYCHSSCGDEYLYHILKTPYVSEHNYDDFENKVEGLAIDEKNRIQLSLCLHDMGRSGKYSVSQYLNTIDNAVQSSNISDIILIVLYIPAVLLCFVNGLLGAGALLVIMIFALSSYFKKKKKIEQYIVCIEYIDRIISNARKIDQIDNISIESEKSELAKLLDPFKKFQRFSSILIGNYGSGPAGVILDYIRMLTHIDLIKCNSMIKQVKENKDNIIKIVSVIGRLDVYLSVGEMRKNLGNYAIPNLSVQFSKLQLTDGYHPLLKNPVANSIETTKGIVLTGSNASGKSTFLKMVAINAILSQSLHTVCASKYEAPFYKIISSMNLKDSITSGESYYMAEIRAIQRILNTQGNVLGFVDEVLRGTNTTERIAASSAILKELSSQKKVVFAATHDMELSSLLSDEYDNYHFEEKIENDDVYFTYILSKGKSTGRNAIRLLDKLGVDSHITDKAENMVKYYEEKGNWCLL